jgi:transposase-like protein
MGVLPSGDESALSGRAARSPRRYDDSFRRYAVKRALEPDVRVADVAEELGVSASTLRRWVKAADGDLTGSSGGAGAGGGAAGSGGGDEAPAAESSEAGASRAEPMVVEQPVAEQSFVGQSGAEQSVAQPLVAQPLVAQPPGVEARVPSTVAPTTVAPAAAFAGPSGSLTDAATSTAKASGHDERHVLAMLDAILEMFPRPGGLPLEADLSEPGPAAHREVEAAADRIPMHPGDDIFPALSSLLPAYRFPIILAGLVAAIWVSTVVPADYALRPVAQSLHVLSLVVSFGAVLVIDWHGLLWLFGRRGLTESTRLAAGAGPLIWGGLAGLIATGALLHPNLHSPLTVTKLVLVLAVAWNGAAMSALRRRMAQLPAYVKPVDLPRRDWQLMMTATVVSQVGWWGAILIGFVNSSR